MKNAEKYSYGKELPSDNETENGMFVHTSTAQFFRGQILPAHFRLYVLETAELEEGQEVGDTRFHQILYWIQGSIVAKG